MHRARGFFLTLSSMAMILAAVMPVARAVAVHSLYIVIVPGPDSLQAAQEAMRVELVRLTGTRAAASDPALAGLIQGARQFIQLERATTTGQVQVLFNEAALGAAISAAGHSLWDANRPLLWVLLPPQDPAVSEALRARLTAAAGERGLPVTVVSPAAAPAVQSPEARDALDEARRAGASAALVAQPLPSDPGMLQWTLTGPTTTGQWTGGPELAIDNATDALASAARTLDQAPLAQYDMHISGVNDLQSLTSVLAAVRAAPGVSQVSVSEVNGGALTLHLEARGSAAALEHVLAGDRLQPSGAGSGGLLEYRYLSGP